MVLQAEERSRSQSGHTLDWLTQHLEPMKECPLCSGRNWCLKFNLGVLRVFRCVDCGMMFLNPHLSPKGMKKVFSSPELLRKINRFLSDYCEQKTWETPQTLSIYRRILKKIGNFLSHKGKLMDIGCGQGTFLKLAVEEGWQAFGVEPNCSNAPELKQTYGIEIDTHDFFEASFTQGEFETVSLWDLIEHVPNPAEMIRRCKQMLKPEGLLVIATPNHFSFLDFLAAFTYRMSFGKLGYALEKLYTADHTLYFTDTTLKLLLQKEGFSILEVVKVNTDLDRYSMNIMFRCVAECLSMLSRLFNLQNRMIVIAKKLQSVENS